MNELKIVICGQEKSGKSGLVKKMFNSVNRLYQSNRYSSYSYELYYPAEAKEDHPSVPDKSMLIMRESRLDSFAWTHTNTNIILFCVDLTREIEDSLIKSKIDLFTVSYPGARIF